MVKAVLAGKTLLVIGNAGPLHSFTYVPDLAAAMSPFEHPFVMDSRPSEAALGLRPTPIKEAAAATVAWWGDQDQ